MINFTGSGAPITQPGLDLAATTAGIDPLVLWTVIAVETSGSGFLADRRPKILFERHFFHRLTGGRFDARAPELSQPTAGGYGAGGAHQYDRLVAALALNEDAALRSASWGLGQIMGDNCRASGYATAAQMAEAFVAAEDAQLLGMARFIAASGMTAALTALNWAGFAKRYNGPGYAKNSYDEKLRAQHQRLTAIGAPDLRLRAVQAYLTYRGFDPGGVDGRLGARTTAAVKAFQTSAGRPVTGAIDDDLLSALAG